MHFHLPRNVGTLNIFDRIPILTTKRLNRKNNMEKMKDELKEITIDNPKNDTIPFNLNPYKKRQSKPQSHGV